MNWYLKVLRQYADFNGRARRMEYWIFVLINLIISFALVLLDNLLHVTIGKLSYGLFYMLYLLVMLLPSIAVCVRRLHDIGKTGWMFLLAFIPFVGPIWLLVLFCIEGEHGANKRGEDPKSIAIPDMVS